MDFQFRELETITNNFSEENRVGSGGYGDVYKGVHNGKEVAVKKLHAMEGRLDDKEFDNEFRNLRKVEHQNVVQLLGYCYESRHKYVEHNGETIFTKHMERLLCFEYMQGGSLEKHITDESCDLDWTTCYKIIKGTCEGLNHLHSVHAKPIYHLDLKPANILLDNNMTPKIADLGLSRLVTSTETHRTHKTNGTRGFMPPEYVEGGAITRKFDVFSLGVIIVKLMDGNEGYSRFGDMGAEQFINHVCENWKKRLQADSGNSSAQMDTLRVKTCVEIATRCAVKERKRRPFINDIVHELEELEAEIEKMTLPCVQSTDLIGQRSRDSNVLAVDPTLELRFLFEPRKEISCCLQLTNKTDGFIAFDIKTPQTKYLTQPSRGTMPPCSKRYISVTLRAQEKAPPNMQCDDVLFVKSASVSTSNGNIQGLFEKLMKEKVVEVIELPIVYVVLDQFSGILERKNWAQGFTGGRAIPTTDQQSVAGFRVHALSRGRRHHDSGDGVDQGKGAGARRALHF